MEIDMMTADEQVQELLNFFKALADANRLKIVGLLAQEDYTVEQLAELLELRPSTVSHHLARLSQAGLVSAQADGYYNVYQLNTGALEDMARRLLAEETLPAVAADVDMDAYDRKVINTYSYPDGRLKDIPTQQKKLLVILKRIAQTFEPGERYSEAQVNEALAGFHEDTAYLRRALVDFGFLQREGGGGEYWLPES
jgi:predicted transcriptional regulator